MATSGLRMGLVFEGERTIGVDLVERMLIHGQRFEDDEVPAEAAASALEALEQLELAHFVTEMVEAGEMLAEQVHDRATRGLQEVVQNAQDQGASTIRFGWRRRARQTELLISHDGHPVQLHDVVAMAYPLISGSRRDAEKIGRFGIGLKTLNQFGERLEVHCAPLPSFTIERGRIASVAERERIPGFWDPDRRETLFVLRLNDERFDRKFFEDWIAEWDASSLIFLPRLRDISLFDLSTGVASVAAHRLEERGAAEVALALPRAIAITRSTLQEAEGERAWNVYRLRYPRPKGLRATNKAVGDEVTIAVAAAHHEEHTRLYTGLPLAEPCTLPFSASAPFDINVDRTRIRDERPLNEWLIARTLELATAIAEERLAHCPAKAWSWMPLRGETAGAERTWLRRQFDEAITRGRDRLKRATLQLEDGTLQRLDGLIVDSERVADLFTSAEIERLAVAAMPVWRRGQFTHRAVPSQARDHGRWWKFLWGLEETTKLSTRGALAALDWSLEDVASRKPDWLPRLVWAGIVAEEEEELWRRRWVVLEGGRRSTPAEIRDGALLLVRSLPEEGLASHLQISAQLGAELRHRGKAGKQVRDWLIDQGLLRERATDTEAVRALADASLEEPLDLSGDDDGLVRLRNVFEQMSSPEREALGPGVGQNIAVSGLTYGAKGESLSTPVRPYEAYLPSAIEKQEGWPSAAGKTPGLRWIDGRYADLLKAGRDRKRQGALAFFRSLGAAVAPRLAEGPPPDDNPHAVLPRHRLSALQLEELKAMPNARTLKDDWVSPDLVKVLEGLIAEKRVTERRRRARSLFVCLHRNWRQYEERATATGAHHYYSWHHDGHLSATWIGHLASTPWMSTKERTYKPRPPKDLAVLTPASIEIEGDDRSRYADEVLEEEADSPLVAALGMEGRPFAQTIVDRLVALREAETTGEPVHQGWVDKCYAALASYCPGGELAAESDLDPAQLRAAFGRTSDEPGLIRVDGHWLSIQDVRTGDHVTDEVPRVTKPEGLWSALGVQPVGVLEVVQVMTRMARESRRDEGVELRSMRLLLRHVGDRNFKRHVARMPLPTHTGWREDRKRPVYAIGNPRLAAVVGRTWDVWDIPIGLHEAQPLIEPLGITVLPDEAFEPDVPSSLFGTSDFESRLPDCVHNLRNYLVREAPAVHDRIDADRWRTVAQARVALGASWRVKVRAAKGKVLRAAVPAYFFSSAGLLAAIDDDEAMREDGGGRAVAHFLLGPEAEDQERALVALAWESQARRREMMGTKLWTEEEDEDEGETTSALPAWARRPTTKSRRSPKPKSSKLKQQRTPRRLVDVEALDSDDVTVLVAGTDREGKVRVQPKKAPRSPDKTRSFTASQQTSKMTSAARDYNDTQREDAGFRLAEARLAEIYGLHLDDLRDQPDVGADAYDSKKDIWVELKTHGGGRPDTVRLESSQAERARENGDRYLLVLVWGLEAPNIPQILVVPDPLVRLDTWLGRGIKLTGLSELLTPETQRHLPP